MRTGPPIGDSRYAGVAAFAILPFLIMFGAAAVLFLETPVMMALTAIALGVAVWMVGTAVTRQGFISGRYSEEVSMCESVDLVPVLEPEIVAMNEVLADGPTAAVTASITNVFGPCPFGLMPGNTWHISADGKLSRPMCLTGATVLSALVRMADRDAMDRSTVCECQLAGGEVSFTVRESAGELLETPG